MSIFLVRHGESLGNRDRIIQPESIALSPLGERQAELLAARFASLDVARVLCSDLVRARMTAAPLVARTGATLVLSPLLRERNFGRLRGTPYSELTCDPFAPDYVPDGGESWPVFHERVAQAFQQIATMRREAEGNLVVVTHGLVLGALLERHVPAAIHAHGALSSAPANTSVTQLSAEPPYPPTLLHCCLHLTELASTDDDGGAGKGPV